MSDASSSVPDVIELQQAAIAGEIHDSLMPYLFTTKMRLESLVARLTDSSQSNSSAATNETFVRAELTMAIETLQEAMTIGRQLIGELCPADILEMFWTDYLNACLERFGNTSDTKLEVQGDFDSLVSGSEKRVAARRIAQEAVRNAARHGNAKTVVVSVKTRGDRQVELSIRDDGRGFNTAVSSRGFGLRIMQSRAKSISASLIVESRLGGPTTVVMTVDRSAMPSKIRRRSDPAPLHDEPKQVQESVE